MKNSSKCKHNTGIYIRKEEGLYSVYSKQGQFMPWALDTKKGRPFSWTRVDMLHFCTVFSAFALQCVEKSLELKQLRENSTAFLTTRKVQEFCNRQLVSLESDLGTKLLWRKHFVKKAFHYHCLDLKYEALKIIVTNKYATLG